MSMMESPADQPAAGRRASASGRCHRPIARRKARSHYSRQMASENEHARPAHRWPAWLLAGAFLLVLVLVVARLFGGAPDAALRGLKDDPMAIYQPRGGRLVSTSERNADRSNFLGKPTQAQYVRVFKLPASANPRAQIRGALRAARAAGWQVYERPNGAVADFMGSLFVTGQKLQPSREAKTIRISVSTSESVAPSGSVSPPAMRIILESPEIDSR